MKEEYKYLGDFSAVDPAYSRYMSCHDCEVSWHGCWDNFECPKCGAGELPTNDIKPMNEESKMEQNARMAHAPTEAEQKAYNISKIMRDKIDSVLEESHACDVKIAEVDCAVEVLKAILAEKGINVAFTRWKNGQYAFECNGRRGKINYDRHTDKYYAGDEEAKDLEDMMTKVSGHIAHMHLVENTYPKSTPEISFTML